MRISSFQVLRGINSLRTWSVRFGSLLLYWLNDKAGSGGSASASCDSQISQAIHNPPIQPNPI